MTNLFTLQCPTCNANLQVAGENNRFICQHCGNNYLLDRKIVEMNLEERKNIQPAATYTRQIQQWLKVAGYAVFLHVISDEVVKKDRVLYIDVEYRNELSTPLTCRHDQWIVYDKEGYTYEPAKDYAFPELYEQNGKRYLGLTRIITPGMRLRGWLGFRLSSSTIIEYLQFSGGTPGRTVEFQLQSG